MAPRTIALASILAASAACSQSPTSEPPPLVDCAPGAWIAENPTCGHCAEGWYTPECDATDCRTAQVAVFEVDGTASTFEARLSRERGTVSVILGCSARGAATWWVDEDGRFAQESEPGGVLYVDDATCTQESFVRGYVHYQRAEGGLDAALRMAALGEECTAVPIL